VNAFLVFRFVRILIILGIPEGSGQRKIIPFGNSPAGAAGLDCQQVTREKGGA
jgi:hypothetical protein